jgi:hypothetical protein
MHFIKLLQLSIYGAICAYPLLHWVKLN